MKITKRTIGLAAVALLLIGGGTAAVQYIGEINTQAEVEEPVTVDTREDSDFSIGGTTNLVSGDTSTLALSTVSESDAPRIVRVLEVSKDSGDYTDLAEASTELNILWSADSYQAANDPESAAKAEGLNDVNVLESSSWVGDTSYGHKAGTQDGNLVVCNAHDEGGYYQAGEPVETSYDITPEYFGGEGSYDIDYSIANECPL